MSLTPGRLRRVATAAALALLAAVGTGCSAGSAGRFVGRDDVVDARSTAALQDRGGFSGRIAIAPFWSEASVSPGRDRRAQQQAAADVGRHVAEAMVARGFDVVGPAEVGAVLGMPDYAVGELDPAAVAWRVRESFGAGEVMLGSVLRYREREGGAAGATSPAGVGFQVTVYGVPDGERLWIGRFDEVQTALFGNVFHASRYPGGGTRWLTADELARWGAGELAHAMPAGAARPPAASAASPKPAGSPTPPVGTE